MSNSAWCGNSFTRLRYTIDGRQYSLVLFFALLFWSHYELVNTHSLMWFFICSCLVFLQITFAGRFRFDVGKRWRYSVSVCIHTPLYGTSGGVPSRVRIDESGATTADGHSVSRSGLRSRKLRAPTSRQVICYLLLCIGNITNNDFI